ncbi:MAG: hypothetical protein DMG55_05040 [Acidobacteria bacterium]|nr:MAG: hypothetical protein DMG55_05040 [Acidobacteriota bacterium]
MLFAPHLPKSRLDHEARHELRVFFATLGTPALSSTDAHAFRRKSKEAIAVETYPDRNGTR